MDDLPANSATKRCPRCGNQIRDLARVCRFCRAEFDVHRRGYCPACNRVVTATETDTCPDCGSALTDLRVDSQLREAAAEPPHDLAAAAPPPPPPTTAGKRTMQPVTAQMRRGFAAAALPFAALMAWAAFLPWLDPVIGDGVSGWDLFRAAGDRGLNRLLAGDLYWPDSGPAFTGLAVVISAAALGVLALAVLVWPKGEPPATGKIPIWLKILVAVTALGAIAQPLVNMFSFILSKPEYLYVSLGHGIGVWTIGACFGAAALALTTAPAIRKRPARAPGERMPRGARIALQITVTILLLIACFAAIGLPCAFEGTEAARRACIRTTEAKVYAGIGIGGAALGLLLTWAGPPILGRRKAHRDL
jgi:hypothetical protein